MLKNHRLRKKSLVLHFLAVEELQTKITI